MSFTMIIFLFIFFPLCVGCNIILERYSKNLSKIFLLLASLFFFAWANYRMVIWLFLFSIITHIIGFIINKLNKNEKIRKTVLVIGISMVILTLFVYKYLPFFLSVIGTRFDTSSVTLRLTVPLGISYLIFSALSFLIDIYRKDAPLKSFWDTFLYIAFFPKIICGPIVLYKNFINMINKKTTLDTFFSGLNRIIIGLAKKLIIADYFGIVLSEIPSSGIDQLTAVGVVFLYGFQLYFDFSGYSDMAIGIGRTLGYQFNDNFNFPYISTSITEFWRRWHISLGTFFKEYVYIPLGGNRKGKGRTLINLSIVFIITGIWHGAGWNYLLWGMMHGIFIVFERLLKNNRVYNAIPKIIKWIFTICIVFLGWQFFRLSSVSEVKKFMSILFGFTEYAEINFTWQYFFRRKVIFFLFIALAGSTLLSSKKIQITYSKVSGKPAIAATFQIILLALFIVSIICMVNMTYSPFIYYQY